MKKQSSDEFALFYPWRQMVIEVVIIQLTASRACFNMHYLEGPHNDTAVGRNSEE